MDNHDSNNKEQTNGNSYESSPEWNVTREDMGLTSINEPAKIDWKSALRKHLRDETPLAQEEQSTPWVINREDMGLSPIPVVFPGPTDGDIWKHTLDVASMSSEALGQGGTNYANAISEAIKNMPADNTLTMYFTTLDNGDMLEEYQAGLPDSKLKDSAQEISEVDFMDITSTTSKNKEVVYITDGEVFHDKLTPEEREFLETQQKNTIESLLKDPNASVTLYSSDSFVRLHTEDSNEVLNRVLDTNSFPTKPLPNIENFRFTEDSVQEYSLDNLASRIKKVNSNLNPSDEQEDNKPKLK